MFVSSEQFTILKENINSFKHEMRCHEIRVVIHKDGTINGKQFLVKQYMKISTNAL